MKHGLEEPRLILYNSLEARAY